MSNISSLVPPQAHDDFHKGRSAQTIELRLRRLFHRALPDSRELRILHGVLADAERMARLAQERHEGS